MKHGKNPTLAQKNKIADRGLNPLDWLVSKDTREELVVINRKTGKARRFLFC